MGLWAHGDKRLCISMQRMVFPIWARLLYRPITLWKLNLSDWSQRQRIPSWPSFQCPLQPLLCGLDVTKLMCAHVSTCCSFISPHLLRWKRYLKRCRTSPTPVPSSKLLGHSRPFAASMPMPITGHWAGQRSPRCQLLRVAACPCTHAPKH